MGSKDIFDEEDIKLIQDEYDSLINNLSKCNNPGDRELIERAFNIANKAHWNMRRKSGEPYVLHPVAVARIVNQEIGLGARSIATSLLHDVVEDRTYLLAMQSHFNALLKVWIGTRLRDRVKQKLHSLLRARP